MRVVAVVSLLLVCSVLAPSAVLAEPVTPLGATTLGSVDVSVGDGSVATVQSTENESNQSTRSNQSSGSLGLQVSSFVQSTSAETNGVVENEMWEANVNRSGRPTEVTRRVDRLDRRVTSLRDRRQSLTNEYENGNLSTLRYRAQLAQLNGELNALSAAASSTERAATRFNTSPRGLSKVRTEIQRSRAETPPIGRFANGDARSNRSNTTRGGPNDRRERNASNRSSERPAPGERGNADPASERNRSGGSPPNEANNTKRRSNGNSANDGKDASDARGQGDEKRPDNADTDTNASTNRSKSGRPEEGQDTENANVSEGARDQSSNAGNDDSKGKSENAGNSDRSGGSENDNNTENSGASGSAANAGNSADAADSGNTANGAKGNRSRSR